MEKFLTILKKVKNVIGTIITIVLLFFAVIIFTQRVSNNNYTFLGFRVFIVSTGSMVPKYNVGDVLFVKTKNIDKIEVGDDLVYLGKEKDYKDKVVTHQIIGISEDDKGRIFETKGIANSMADPLVSESQVYGTVLSKLKILTFFYRLLGNMYTMYFVVIVPLVIYIFMTFIHTGAPRKKEVRKEK